MVDVIAKLQAAAKEAAASAGDAEAGAADPEDAEAAEELAQEAALAEAQAEAAAGDQAEGAADDADAPAVVAAPAPAPRRTAAQIAAGMACPAGLCLHGKWLAPAPRLQGPATAQGLTWHVRGSFLLATSAAHVGDELGSREPVQQDASGVWCTAVKPRCAVQLRRRAS